jgi:hypothetical protein
MEAELVPNSSSLRECPYDSSHKVFSGQLYFHMVKCRASIMANRGDPRRKSVKELVHCDYNRTHVCAKDDLDVHHKACPSKGRDDVDEIMRNIKENIRKGEEARRAEDHKKKKKGDEDACEENWDLEEGRSPFQDIVHSNVALAKREGRDVAEAEKEKETEKMPAAACIPGMGDAAPMSKSQKKKQQKNKKNKKNIASI